jgi:hypothetical protein
VQYRSPYFRYLAIRLSGTLVWKFVQGHVSLVLPSSTKIVLDGASCKNLVHLCTHSLIP